MNLAHAKGIVPCLPENVDLKWLFAELTSTGATGDPTKGTAEKGRLMVDAVVDIVVDFIAKMRSAKWRYGWEVDKAVDSSSGR